MRAKKSNASLNFAIHDLSRDRGGASLAPRVVGVGWLASWGSSGVPGDFFDLDVMSLGRLANGWELTCGARFAPR